uniref:LIM zinc-binding domain-containing protein n=1 Tax=Fagus sylvatica TaxID=28930 RepID=A0A2N9J3F9_FAGSY
MAFSGTLQKCKACDKTVHFIELLSADGVPYHKTCFKCSHCNGVLVFVGANNVFVSIMDNQLEDHNNELNRAPSKLSSMFSGTQEKCEVCKKTVYPLEKVTIEGNFYHKPCFRCAHGGCFLTQSSYASLDGFLYCKHHFSQLFKEKGSYNHLTKTASLKKNGPVLPEENGVEEPKLSMVPEGEPGKDTQQ